MAVTSDKSRAALTAQIINPILTSVIETFDITLGCPIARNVAALRRPEDELLDRSVVFYITGPARGAVCMSFSDVTASQVARELLQGSIQTGEDEADALSEIANMVVGSAKSSLDMGLNMGLPNVVDGRDAEVAYPTGSQPVRLHFDSEMGSFFVEFAFAATGF